MFIWKYRIKMYFGNYINSFSPLHFHVVITVSSQFFSTFLPLLPWYYTVTYFHFLLYNTISFVPAIAVLELLLDLFLSVNWHHFCFSRAVIYLIVLHVRLSSFSMIVCIAFVLWFWTLQFC